MRWPTLPVSLLCVCCLPALVPGNTSCGNCASAFAPGVPLLSRHTNGLPLTEERSSTASVPAAAAAAASARLRPLYLMRGGSTGRGSSGGAAAGSTSPKKRAIPQSAPGLMVVGEGTLGEVEGEVPPSLWNVPNVLTLARLVCVPILGAVFYMPLPSRNVWCAAIFAGAAITDWLDGWWARKFNIASPFGAFLDPVADKLIVAVAMILLSERVGVWMTVCTSIILCREIAVSALREWMAQIGARGVVKVGMAGKCKTAAQMVALTALLLLQPGSHVPFPLPAATFAIAQSLMIFSTVLTITSGTGYLQAAWPALMGKDANASR